MTAAAHGHRHTIAFVAASIVWAAVAVATGDVAWPIAMWMTTALGPFASYRHATSSPAPR